jgi:hypothetical protein
VVSENGPEKPKTPLRLIGSIPEGQGQGEQPKGHEKGAGRTRRAVHKRPPDALLFEVISKNGGIVTLVAKACGVGPSCVTKWRKKSSKVEEMFRAVREMNLDLAESKVLQAIQAGRTAECLFYLKCMGKSRGWIERQEIEQVGPSTVREELAKEQARLKNPKYREAMRAYFAAAEEADRSTKSGVL